MKTSPKQFARAWHRALQQTDRAEWDAVSKRLLLLVQRQGHSRSLPVIKQLITEYDHAAHARIPVTVKTAHALDQQTLAAAVQRVLGSGVRADITTQIDPELLGGISIETKNSRWNMSLQAQLHQLVKTINA